MIQKLLISLFISVLFIGLAGAEGDKIVYQVDAVHSSISFNLRHMVVNKVRGQFNDFSVTIEEDSKDITQSSVTAVIKTASIDTGNTKRDEHLRSADFFDSNKYPEITFKSKKIVKKGEKNYTITGILTMHGISRDIDIDFEIAGKINTQEGTVRMGIEGYTELDRKDYGLTWNRTLDKGGLAVGNEVKIELFLSMINK